LPPGVLNVLNGDRNTVEALLAAPEVQAVSFVGSTPVAEAVYRQASARGIRAQALGGAKNHLVVLPDADPAQVCAALMGAACAEAGQDAMESKSRSRMSARSAMFGVRSLWARASFVRGDVSCAASHVAIMLRS
jgi:acyl-CoA reductase-like NAD-dependent aldehyde dehydrogenase